MKALLLPSKTNQEYLIKYFPVEYNKCLNYFYGVESVSNIEGISEHLYVMNECSDITMLAPYYDDNARKNLQKDKIITLVPFKLDKCVKMIFDKKEELEKNYKNSYNFQTEFKGSISVINVNVIDNSMQLKWGELKCLITDQ